MMDTLEGLHANFGGYFSYLEGDTAKCIFYGKGDTSEALVTFSYVNVVSSETATIGVGRRSFTELEKIHYDLIKVAKSEAMGDALFVVYENTRLNFIPLIWQGERKVYIITGTGLLGVVPLGNDYLLTFDGDNKLVSKNRIHDGLVPICYEVGDSTATTTSHSHHPPMSQVITPTDICTLMLYEHFTNWESHLVLSDEYASLWSCRHDDLLIMQREVFDGVLDDVEGMQKQDEAKKKRKKPKK